MRVDRDQIGRARGGAVRWPVTLGVIVLAVLAHLAGALDPFERALTDTRFRLLDRDASGTVVIVGIDPRSLTALDSWPWPRAYHADLVDRLVEAGAAEIAIDIDLSSRSNPEDDARLAAAFERSGGRVILPVFNQLETGEDGEVRVVHNGPHPTFRRQVRIASVNTIPAADGLIRRHEASHRWQDDVILSMPALLAAPVPSMFDVFDIDFGIRADTIPRASYVDVLRGDFDPALFAGRRVVVGATAVELGDQFAAPVYKALAGPVVQAMAYESIIQGRTLKRSSSLLAVGLMLLVTLLTAGWFIRWPWRRGLALLASIAAGSIALSFALQAWSPMQLEVTPVLFAALLLFAGGLAVRADRLDLKLLMRRLHLHRSGTLMRNVVEYSSEGIVTLTADHVIEFANPAAGAVFGMNPPDMAGRRFASLLEGDTDPRAMDALIGDSAARPREAVGRRADGDSVPLELTANRMVVYDEVKYVLLIRDVTEQRAQQELLEYLALHDTLTGLPNRALLLDRVDQAIARARRENSQLALMLLDLDRFKQINDTLGHAMGDALLAEIGQALGAPLRRSDTIARLGGDEFAILLPAITSIAQVREVAERVAGELARPFQLGEMTVDVGVSIGIAMYPDHGEDSSQLMRSADVAMYVAKRERTTVSLYASAKDENSRRGLAMGAELRTALDEGQLTIFYQPTVDLVSGRPVGAEALVRWNHPTHGLMLPGEFVPLAEQINLVRPLTRWMLGHAVRRIAAWTESNLDLGVSVNLSMRNLYEEDLAPCLAELLSKHDVPASRLTLEITEDAMMDDPDRALAAIRQLNDIGVRMAIDDFGTGYSSLSYLKALPVDQLKIDKSFVIGMTRDQSDEVIVRSTIDLAHNLGLQVVAEGVEGAEHAARLKELGCDIGQGFYLGKPQPIEEFDGFIARSAIGIDSKVVELNPNRRKRRKPRPNTVA